MKEKLQEKGESKQQKQNLYYELQKEHLLLNNDCEKKRYSSVCDAEDHRGFNLSFSFLIIVEIHF